MTASKRNWKATQAEAEALNTAKQLIARLENKIADRERAGRNGERHWGHAGDADHIVDTLLNLHVTSEIRNGEGEAECRARILGSL